MAVVLGPQSFFGVLHTYLTTLEGHKNVAKFIVYKEQLYGMLGWAPSKSLLPAHAKIVKTSISAMEVVTKASWLIKVFDPGIERKKKLQDAASWTMSVHDFLSWASSVKIMNLAKGTLFCSLCVFNGASVVFSVLCIKAGLKAYNEAGKEGSIKKRSEVIGMAISVAYLALFVFSVPALLPIAFPLVGVVLQYKASLEAAQWGCLVFATSAAVTKYFHDGMYLPKAKAS